jgi:hypothetical protein
MNASLDLPALAQGLCKMSWTTRNTDTRLSESPTARGTQSTHIGNDTRDVSRRIPDASIGAICRRNCVASDRACTRVTPPSSMVRRGRRFESVRGLCKSAGNRRFLVQGDLLLLRRAVGMEPFMELSSSERLAIGRGARISGGRRPRRSSACRNPPRALLSGHSTPPTSPSTESSRTPGLAVPGSSSNCVTLASLVLANPRCGPCTETCSSVDALRLQSLIEGARATTR